MLSDGRSESRDRVPMVAWCVAGGAARSAAMSDRRVGVMYANELMGKRSAGAAMLIAVALVGSVVGIGCAGEKHAPASAESQSQGVQKDAASVETRGVATATEAAKTPTVATAVDPYADVNTVDHDRDVWMELLDAHASIRRTVWHTQTMVGAVTESDDPKVSAKIKEHTKAMQTRMKAGASVRNWDPVFKEMFEKHRAMKLEVVETEKGVRITEMSDDPEALALLRSHAMGVSEFIREGGDASSRETKRIRVGDPLPPTEVSIGGVRHRLLLVQPSGEQLAQLKAEGAKGVVNFRKPAEHEGYDEAQAATDAAMTYSCVAYVGAAELTDEVIDRSRAAIRDADQKGEIVVLHCCTGARVGPAWAAYRALDAGVPVERAIDEARALQMTDRAMIARVREYIQTHRGE